MRALELPRRCITAMQAMRVIAVLIWAYVFRVSGTPVFRLVS